MLVYNLSRKGLQLNYKAGLMYSYAKTTHDTITKTIDYIMDYNE